MVETRIEGLLVRAEPLQLAEEISQRMVDVVRVEDGVLLLEVDPGWAGAINTVPVAKGIRVNELRMETTAGRLIA
jgi:predicted ATP-grasp superfamily ATP-dependent carboligase